MENRCYHCPGLDPDVAPADVDYFCGHCGCDQRVFTLARKIERGKKGEWSNWLDYVFWFNLGFVVCVLLGLF